MHHTINLAYGDSVTIHTPEHAPIKLQSIKLNAIKENIKQYQVFETVCNATGITIDEILGPRRTPNLVLARCYIAMHLLKNYHITLSHIARLLSRDHTTIIHYRKMYKNLSDVKDSYLLMFLNQLEQYEKGKIEA
jgi:chromosomal replication initiation ATPase DnaA